jgi:hypothetical protein
MAVHPHHLRPAIPNPRGRKARPVSGLPTLSRGELIALLRRLHGELEAFLNDLGARREPSRNRDVSRRI